MRKYIRILLLCFLFTATIQPGYAKQQTSEDTGDVGVYGTVSFMQDEKEQVRPDDVPTGDTTQLSPWVISLFISGAFVFVYFKKAVHRQQVYTE